MSTSGKWEFFIDRGGTFTDIVARTPDGTLVTRKLLSENPEAYEDAAIAGVADLLGSTRGRSLPSHLIAKGFLCNHPIAVFVYLKLKGSIIRRTSMTTAGWAWSPAYVVKRATTSSARGSRF